MKKKIEKISLIPETEMVGNVNPYLPDYPNAACILKIMEKINQIIDFLNTIENGLLSPKQEGGK